MNYNKSALLDSIEYQRKNKKYIPQLLNFISTQNEEIVKIIISTANPDVNAKEYNRNLLELACSTQNIPIIKLLLDAGAMFNDSSYIYPSSLYTENRYFYNNEEIIQLLLSNPNCNFHFKDFVFMCNVHINQYHDKSVVQKSLKLAKLLLEAGANVNFQDSFGNTALHLACENNNIDVIKFLVENNCNLNIPNSGNKTALDIASKNNHFDIVNFLFECGCFIPDDYLYKYPHMLNILENFLSK